MSVFEDYVVLRLDFLRDLSASEERADLSYGIKIKMGHVFFSPHAKSMGQAGMCDMTTLYTP